MTESAATLRYSDLAEGASFTQAYRIDESVYTAFLKASDDRSPLHVDEAFAKALGHPGRVMHGSILNAFTSHFVGMVCPGERALLLSVDLRFHAPNFLGDELILEGRIAQRIDAQQVIVLQLKFTNKTRGVLAASGRAQVRVSGG